MFSRLRNYFPQLANLKQGRNAKSWELEAMATRHGNHGNLIEPDWGAVQHRFDHECPPRPNAGNNVKHVPLDLELTANPV